MFGGFLSQISTKFSPQPMDIEGHGEYLPLLVHILGSCHGSGICSVLVLFQPHRILLPILSAILLLMLKAYPSLSCEVANLSFAHSIFRILFPVSNISLCFFLVISSLSWFTNPEHNLLMFVPSLNIKILQSSKGRSSYR